MFSLARVNEHDTACPITYSDITRITDLSLPLVDEKAELPAIIVTPSSPGFETEFFIAFIAPPPSPTFSQRLSTLVPAFRSYLPSQIQLPSTPFKTTFDERSGSSFSLRGRIRTIVLVFLLLFIMASHVVLHRVASNHPHLDFGMHPDNDIDFSALSRAEKDVVGGRVGMQDAGSNWWNRATSTADFVVEEPAPAPEQGNDNDTSEVRPEAVAA